MPWKANSVMDGKLQFVTACLRREAPMTVLCERFGISRETGHLWWRRYLSEGGAGLVERSRRPHRLAHAISAEVSVRLVEARRRKPYWGPKKLLAILRAEDPGLVWPAASTVSELFRREGLSAPRRRRRRPLSAEQPFAAVEAANDAWCIDFKGWFRTGDGRRCDPLTVTDAFSRYLLGVRIMEPVTAEVEAEMTRLFRAHGLPGAIRSDNGPPFASHGVAGLTRLSASWVKQGVRLERIEPGRPQQNGRHERMHRTLKAETCTPPAPTREAQQDRFDAFRREYNHERPHEALGQRPPAELYRPPPPRPFQERPDDPAYGPDEQVRRVRSSGEIKWRGTMVFVSEALVGEAVGTKQREDGHWLVRFADVPLLLIDRSSDHIARFGPARPARSEVQHQPPGLSGMCPD